MRSLQVPALLFAALALPTCSTVHGRKYDNSDLVLVTAYTAKDACSCIFVMGQSEEYCRAWTRASPNVASFAVDREAKVVESSALLFWGARARYLGGSAGCVLEE